MNAFTSSDHTTYPFATTNAQDFKNLMSVYLDATLHPLLNVNDFTQEGWRIGPENPTLTQADGAQGDKSSPLVFKGVVYNEMKGQMSDASYLFYVRFQDSIFPAIHNSGGDPQKMTDLTYEQLKKFHADHYHPSNAKLFTYGNMPLKEHLQEISQRLEKFNPIQVDADIKSPIILAEPQSVTVKGPLDPLLPPDMQYKTSTTWMMGETSNILETFSLGVLSSLLLDGYGSPLYRALIESGLGTDYSPNTGFDTAAHRGIFSIGLNGVKKEDVAKVRETLFHTLAEVKENGFDKIKVDGILHQLELALKHKTAHFGMGVMQRLQPGWFNGVDPLDSLSWSTTVSAFKSEYAKEGYLEGLLEKYLLNENTLTFTMEPSEEFGQELVEEEQQRLASKIAETAEKFSNPEEAHKFLEKRELELLKVQEEARHQDLSVLPTVHVKDIPREDAKYELRHSKMGDVNVQWREAHTNGLTYFRAINVFNDLPDELRELIPLFSDSIMRLGTPSKSVEHLEELIKLKTGGLSVGYHSSTSPHDVNIFEEGLAFSGYALDRNIPDMYDLMRQIVMEADFDSPDTEKKIRQLLQGSASGAINAIAESGHGYARRFAHAGLTPEGRVLEQTAGLTQVKLIASLATRPEEDSFGDVIRKLKAIQSFAIANTSSLRVAITCGNESSVDSESALQDFLASIPSNPVDLGCTRPKVTFARNSKSFFPLPYQVYYSAVAIPTVPYVNADGASLQILSQLLTHKHLHHEIREKGGAYGGGAYSNGLGGIFGFYSYRDPNPQNTMNIIKDAGVWARDRKWTAQDIEEAKLSVFQSLDAPQSVSAEGMTQFLTGVNQEMKQKRRLQLLDVTAEDVKKVAEQYLIHGVSEGNTAILGEKKDWVKEQDGWAVKDMGMADKVQEVLQTQEGEAAEEAPAKE